MSDENQIHLQGEFRREEYSAAEAITPGHLIELTSSGTVQKHSTEGGDAERMFAEGDFLQGSTIDDAYAADDLVSANIEEPGSVIQAFLKAGENVTDGVFLISGGDGTLIEEGSETSGTTIEKRIAMSLEDKDLSGSGAVATLIKVRVI